MESVRVNWNINSGISNKDLRVGCSGRILLLLFDALSYLRDSSTLSLNMLVDVSIPVSTCI